MQETLIAILIITAYLLGSIPTSVWVGKFFYGVDVRTKGSGNAGATNTIRVLGWKAGVPVLLFDVLKAWLAVMLPVFFGFELDASAMIYFQLILGVVALGGHVFPVFAGFRGGKGVASATGIVLALYPAAFLVVLGVFLAVLLISGYVSLASMISAVAFPFVAVFVFGISHPALVIFAVLLAVFVPLLHVKNIRRLLKGTESKILYRRNGPGN